MFPFDKAIFLSSLRQAVLIGLIGFVFIQWIWGEIIVDDLIGMGIAIPMIAYLIHTIKLFR